MGSDLNVLFYIGILVPTTITIGFFIGFLICWFRCTLKNKLILLRQQQQQNGSTKNSTQKEVENIDNTDKTSQHSADSAIDVRDVETTTGDELDRVKHMGEEGAAGGVINQACEEFMLGNPQTLPMSVEAQVHAQISPGVCKGTYPSYEKLNEEIHSEPRIYERQEDIENAMREGLVTAASLPYQFNPRSQQIQRLVYNQHTMYNSAPRILFSNNTSYNTNILTGEDNHSTDYGFATWHSRPRSLSSRPSSIASTGAGGVRMLSLFKNHNQSPIQGQLEWKPNITNSCSDNYSIEIMHV